LRGQTYLPTAIAFSSGGDRLASVDYPKPTSQVGSIRIWGLQERICELNCGSMERVFGLTFAKDGSLFGFSHDGHIVYWRDPTVARQKPSATSVAKSLKRIALAPDGDMLAVAVPGPAIRLYRHRTQQFVRREFETLDGEISAMVFSPNGEQLAVGTMDGNIYVMDCISGRCAANFAHARAIVCLAFEASGLLLGSGGADKKAMVWDIAHKTKKNDIVVEHEDNVAAVAFSEDGTNFISSCDERLILTNVEQPSGKRQTLDGGTDLDQSTAAINATGTLLASGDSKGRICLYDVEAGFEWQRLPHMFSQYINSIAISRDGRWMAATADGARAYLFELAVGPLEKRAERVANRSLTQQERFEYMK
jgi:WD40 repeat protein